MADSKNLLEALVETQTQSMSNLMEANKKMQDAFGKQDAMEQMVAIYKDWYSKQEGIAKAMTDTMRGQMITDKTPDFIKQWIENQEKYGQQWATTMKDMQEKMSSGNTLMDAYKENSEKMFGAWKKAYDQFAGMYTTTFGLEKYDITTQAKEMFDQFVKNSQDYLKMLEDTAKGAKK